jgi:hypothetical protein
MDEYIGFFIGPNKISKLTKIKRLTYFGKEVYRVEYENGIIEERPKEIIEKIASKEKYDWTELRDRISKIVVEKILAILLEAEVKLEDIDYILQLTAKSLNTNLEQATEYMWGKKVYDRTIEDVQEVLTKYNNQKK